MSRLQEDSVYVGMTVSAFLTITMFYFFYTVDNWLIGDVNVNGSPYAGVNERFIAILTLLCNILPFVIYIRARKDHSMRGVGIVTVILALFIMVYYFALDKITLFP